MTTKTTNEIDPIGFWLLVAGVGGTTYLESAWLFGQTFSGGTAVLWMCFSLAGVLYSLLTDEFAPASVLAVRLGLLTAFVAGLALLQWAGLPGLTHAAFALLWTWRWLDLWLMAVGLTDAFEWPRFGA